jgi:hypothetical protein
MSTTAMDESSFWAALEYRVCREMAGVPDLARAGMWCDGFVAHSVDVDAHPVCIRGQAWIGLGPVQEAWTFELWLPECVRPAQISWSLLLPAENVTHWLSVDRGRKHLLLAPGDAVPDAARFPVAPDGHPEVPE